MLSRIDVGWATPPFGIREIEQGNIRVLARALKNLRLATFAALTVECRCEVRRGALQFDQMA